MVKALIFFILTYVLLLLFPRFRAYIALASAALFVALGILPAQKVFSSVDWNVIMMIAGTMGVVYFFIESKMPSLLADNIIEKVPDVKWAIISLALFAGIISAFECRHCFDGCARSLDYIKKAKNFSGSQHHFYSHILQSSGSCHSGGGYDFDPFGKLCKP